MLDRDIQDTREPKIEFMPDCPECNVTMVEGWQGDYCPDCNPLPCEDCGQLMKYDRRHQSWHCIECEKGGEG